MDRKKNELIIELTDVVEEALGQSAGGWGKAAPPPVPEQKTAELPKAPRPSRFSDDLRALPDSPLKKFLLAEEEPDSLETPATEEKPLESSQPASHPPQVVPGPPRHAAEPSIITPAEPPRIPPEVPRVAPEPPRRTAEPSRFQVEPPRVAPEPPKVAPEPPRPAPEVHRIAPEPPRPSLPNIEAEMRGMREAMLARVEKWVAQEGVQVLERVAREVFPKLAEDMIRKEIEKLKVEAEEKE